MPQPNSSSMARIGTRVSCLPDPRRCSPHSPPFTTVLLHKAKQTDQPRHKPLSPSYWLSSSSPNRVRMALKIFLRNVPSFSDGSFDMSGYAWPRLGWPQRWNEDVGAHRGRWECAVRGSGLCFSCSDRRGLARLNCTRCGSRTMPILF